MQIFIKKSNLYDEEGRQILLRGCNLGGSSKVPTTPNGATWRKDSLENPRAVSFVGRPFPLEEADMHVDRLASWGFNCVRFIVTWEGIEHEGPGIYDEAYLAYLRKIIKKLENRNIGVYMDPHQDVWSRWTGGDGAPAWVFDILGIDIGRLSITGAALTHQEKGDPFPKMVWPTNYNRYGAATLFTLFFGGNVYAPHCMVEGTPIQEFLQQKYIAAMRHCYRRLKDCKNIIGWGTMNEPHPGYIGYQNLENLENNSIALGPIPSAFQSMVAASGYTVEVPVYKTGILGTRVIGKEIVNSEKISLFKEGFSCPWKKEGVWTDEGGIPRLLKKDYFAYLEGRPVRFVDDFLKPFMKKFIASLSEVQEKCLFFIEGVPNGDHPSWDKNDGDRCINAFHWYDGATLFSKKFFPWVSVRSDNRQLVVGKRRVLESFIDQLYEDIRWTQEHMNNMPCLLGEFGLPFDLFNKKAYKTGDYSLHEIALDMYYSAIEALKLHATIWNYTADNSHERGDQWNDEDLSIVGPEGPRAMRGWLRPYPRAIAGELLFYHWDYKKRFFSFRYEANPNITAPTEVYLPAICIGAKPHILVVDNRKQSLPFTWDSEKGLLLITTPKEGGSIEVTVQGED